MRSLLSFVLISILAVGGAVADTLVVANKGEATVSLIDLGTGTVTATLPTGEGPHEVAVSRDGRRALITDYGKRGAPGSTLTLIDVVAARVLKTIDLGDYTRPHGALFLGPQRAVVTAEDDQALLIVDLEAGAVTKAIATGQAVSHMVAMTPDGTRAFVANIGSGSVTAIDLGKGERLANVATGEGAEGVAVAAGGKQLWVTNRAADSITVLDAASLAPIETFASAGFPIRATATPNGKHVLVTRARAGDLMIYDTAELGSGRAVALDIPLKDTEDRLFGDRFGDSSVPIGVVVSEDGARVWIAHANSDVISEHALPGGERTRLLSAGREPDGMAYTPLAVATAGGAR